ncbi:MAG: LpxA family transferase [Saprospiraceae bacterium]|nr:LpxA family transferase [Saprospiraceae bacterium]
MIKLTSFLQRFEHSPFYEAAFLPWQILPQLPNLISQYQERLDRDYLREGEALIHTSARIESGVTLKGPMVIGPNCFIGAHAYLRGGVFLDEKVSIGPGCEIKSSILFAGAAAAHFNFVGDSIVGSQVNFEAGAITANHYNERVDKRIFVTLAGKRQDTGVIKFGALIGDGSRIGANAVLSPGTILSPGSVVGRLELVEQNPAEEA